MPKMRVFGNLMNRIQEGVAVLTPVVGMGGTILMFSDRVAVTVVEVAPKRIVVQEDEAIRTDTNGMSDSQQYRYEPNPKGSKTAFSLRKNGAWIEEGKPMRSGTHILLGERDHYYDYGF